jgi:hypothetical protein
MPEHCAGVNRPPSRRSRHRQTRASFRCRARRRGIRRRYSGVAIRRLRRRPARPVWQRYTPDVHVRAPVWQRRAPGVHVRTPGVATPRARRTCAHARCGNAARPAYTCARPVWQCRAPGVHVCTSGVATPRARRTRAHARCGNAARSAYTCALTMPQCCGGANSDVFLTRAVQRAYIFCTKSKVVRSPALAAVGGTDVLDSTSVRTGAGV